MAYFKFEIVQNTLRFNAVTLKRHHIVRILVLVAIILVALYWIISTVKFSSSSNRNLNSPHSSHLIRKDNSRASGLVPRNNAFYLNGEEFRIHGGSLHYFRIPPEYWEDRLVKLKAAGLNTVDVYMPWNLHEEIIDTFIFSDRLDVRKFITLAHNLGLYVILRPGPYICAEWDLGGLPSWLLSYKDMKLRSNKDQRFMDAALKYLKEVGNQVLDLQYTQGGPIIAIQIENEYGSYGSDPEYMVAMKKLFLIAGFRELLFTSDNLSGLPSGTTDGVFAAANFKEVNQLPEIQSFLQNLQPNAPLLVMELWTGWYDMWGIPHQTWDVSKFSLVLHQLLQQNASFNLYMFHGGTNFGFMNGADKPYSPMTTSYDYDAVLTEDGGYTEKFTVLRRMFNKKVMLPDPPPIKDKMIYPTIVMDQCLSMNSLLNLVQPIKTDDFVAMEMLPINNGGGQGYGFILYRFKTKGRGYLRVQGQVRDYAQIYYGSNLLLSAEHDDVDMRLETMGLDSEDGEQIDVLVENQGRVKYALEEDQLLNYQQKGFMGRIVMNRQALQNPDVYPLDFNPSMVKKIQQSTEWTRFKPSKIRPVIVRGLLTITQNTADTYLDMSNWTKGVVFINGFNIGRYWNKGPTLSLYVPAPLLKTGPNEILIFDLEGAASEVRFSREHVYKSIQ